MAVGQIAESGVEAASETITVPARVPTDRVFDLSINHVLATSLSEAYGGRMMQRLEVQTLPGKGEGEGEGGTVLYRLRYGDLELDADSPMWPAGRIKRMILRGMTFEVEVDEAGELRLADDLDAVRAVYRSNYADALAELESLELDELSQMSVDAARSGVAEAERAPREQIEALLLADLLAWTACMGLSQPAGRIVRGPGGRLPELNLTQLASSRESVVARTRSGGIGARMVETVDLESVRESARAEYVHAGMQDDEIDAALEMVDAMYGGFRYEYAMEFDAKSGAPSMAAMTRRLNSIGERRVEIVQVQRLDWSERASEGGAGEP
ncbi:MAG: hypothetical protein AAFO89_04000 [Planctomycetota bacterium]